MKEGYTLSCAIGQMSWSLIEGKLHLQFARWTGPVNSETKKTIRNGAIRMKMYSDNPIRATNYMLKEKFEKQ